AVQPERAGAGIVVIDQRDRVVRIANKPLPPMTNNEAEYAGLLMALEAAHELAAQMVEIRLDSEVVIHQMTGKAAVNSANLRRWHKEACTLAFRFRVTRFIRIPRELNGIADALAVDASHGRIWRMPETA